jgi:putative effector of murein hydrolase
MKIEMIFDVCMAIIAGIFAGAVIGLSFTMALAKAIPELFKK